MPDPRVTPKQKERVAKRAGNRCEYCQSPEAFALHTFHVEHIIPRVRDGKTTLSNLAFSCAGCNSLKHTKVTGRDPISYEIVSLYHPRQDRWATHFAWSDDLLQLVGLTAVGRATIITLQLNRLGLLNVRRALFAVSAHPPGEID
jgi:hypothetical protein